MTSTESSSAASPLLKTLRPIVIFIAILWAICLLDLLLPIRLTDWGILPRRITGLIGIPFSPWLHDGPRHLLSNTVPLFILLVLFVSSRKSPWLEVAEIALLSGLLLWIFGRNGSGNELMIHVGASGLIYGLIAYLVVIGFRERHPISLVIAIIVGFIYGGTFFMGIIPGMRGVSWEGHLTGAIAGALLAIAATKQSTD
jgi:membrane associated rhomboid family serine protease